MLTSTTDTLRERLLSKIVMPGPATPCATWVGAYNTSHGLRKGHQGRYQITRRPVIWWIASAVYVAPLMLEIIAGIDRPGPDRAEACHTCPTGTRCDGMYSCVDLAHLRWGSRDENEADKRS